MTFEGVKRQEEMDAMLFMAGTLKLCSLLLMICTTAASANNSTVFRNVNVIPMNIETIIENQTVVVRDDTIAAVGNPGSIVLPPDAAIIDGHGAYMMPGLADMHTHLYSFDKDPAHLILHLAHGVTTVRSMSGTPGNLWWREGAGRGELIAPNIYSSGRVLTGLYGNKFGIGRYIKLFHAAVFFLPLIAGTAVILVVILAKRLKRRRIAETSKREPGKPVIILIPLIVLAVLGITLSRSRIIPFMSVGRYIVESDYYISETPFQAALEVRRQKRAGYDLLKVYDYLTEGEYLAAVKEAGDLEFYVSGHLPDQIPLETVVGSGLDEIAHVDELQSYHWNGYNPEADIGRPAENKLYPFEYASIPRTVESLGDNGINAVSTLVVKETMYRLIEDTRGVLAGAEYGLIRKDLLHMWKTRGRNVTTLKGLGAYRRDGMQPFLLELTKELYRNGVTIAIGTDTGVEGIIPGYHLHRELEILVEAGLTPYEALEMGTKNAGVIVGQMGLDGNFGTIEVGKKADLILIGSNPLEEISSTRNRIGVMVRGNWYTQEELNEMLLELVNGY